MHTSTPKFLRSAVLLAAVLISMSSVVHTAEQKAKVEAPGGKYAKDAETTREVFKKTTCVSLGIYAACDWRLAYGVDCWRHFLLSAGA